MSSEGKARPPAAETIPPYPGLSRYWPRNEAACCLQIGKEIYPLQACPLRVIIQQIGEVLDVQTYLWECS